MPAASASPRNRELELSRFRRADLQRRLRVGSIRTTSRPGRRRMRTCWSSCSALEADPSRLAVAARACSARRCGPRAGIRAPTIRSSTASSRCASSAASSSSPPSRCSSTCPTSRSCSRTHAGQGRWPGALLHPALRRRDRARPALRCWHAAPRNGHISRSRRRAAPVPQPARLQPRQRLGQPASRLPQRAALGSAPAAGGRTTARRSAPGAVVELDPPPLRLDVAQPRIHHRGIDEIDRAAAAGEPLRRRRRSTAPSRSPSV